MKRKLLAALMAVVMLLGLTGCEGSIGEMANKLGVGSWLSGNDDSGNSDVDENLYDNYEEGCTLYNVEVVISPADPSICPTAQDYELQKRQLKELSGRNDITIDENNKQIIIKYEESMMRSKFVLSIAKDSVVLLCDDLTQLQRIEIRVGNEVDEIGNPIGKVLLDEDDLESRDSHGGVGSYVDGKLRKWKELRLKQSGIDAKDTFLQQQAGKTCVVSLWLDKGAVWEQQMKDWRKHLSWEKEIEPRYIYVGEAVLTEDDIGSDTLTILEDDDWLFTIINGPIRSWAAYLPYEWKVEWTIEAPNGAKYTSD